MTAYTASFSEVPSGAKVIISDLRDTVGVRALPAWRDRRVHGLARYTRTLDRMEREETKPTEAVWDGSLQGQALEEADLFYGSPDFTRMLRGAWAEFDLDHGHDDWPQIPAVGGGRSTQGTLYLSAPIRVIEEPSGVTFDVRYLQWDHVALPEQKGVFVIAFWVVGWDHLGRECSSRAVLELTVDEAREYVRLAWLGHPDRMAARMGMAAWGVLNQQNLVERVDQEPDRVAITRARKRRERKPCTVHVVRLRREARQQQAAVEAALSGDSRYRHRFVVGLPNGFYRMQPYGKGRGQRRRILIQPYVKGPDGAPLLEKSATVYEW